MNNFWESCPNGATVLQQRCIEEELFILKQYEPTQYIKYIITYLESRHAYLKTLNSDINN